MFQEIIFTILIQLRKWLQDFHVFFWKYKIIRKTFHNRVYEPKNAELKNKHLGKRAFIIGNGPSILKQDLTKLKDEVTFVLNDFILHPQFHQINPAYLCSCDTYYLKPENRIRWYKLHKKINTKKTIMFLKKAAQKVDIKYGLFKEHKVYYLRSSSMLLPPLSSLKYCPTDITMPLSGHNLVLIDMALLAAYYMGIKKIYLVGFDSQLIKSFKDYYNYDFYGKHPLFSIKQQKKDYRFHVLSQAFKNWRKGLQEKSIACIKRTFARRGVKIYNATYKRGNLKGFDYVNFEDIIKK